jgi:hypothetical protein
VRAPFINRSLSDDGGAGCRLQGTVRVFWQDFALDDAIGSHACSFETLQCVCDQWYSSLVLTPLTGSHCKLRPNTEGQDLSCGPLNSTFRVVLDNLVLRDWTWTAVYGARSLHHGFCHWTWTAVYGARSLHHGFCPTLGCQPCGDWMRCLFCAP